MKSIGKTETAITVLSAAQRLGLFRRSSLLNLTTGDVTVRFVDVRGFVSWVRERGSRTVGTFRRRPAAGCESIDTVDEVGRDGEDVVGWVSKRITW